MADIVTDLASKCGISAEDAQKGLGAVLAFLKSKLPAEIFSKIESAVPSADNMMSRAAELSGEGSGVLDALKGAIGKVFGSGTGDILAKFSKLGLSPEQIQGFIQKVLEFLKGKLPENVMAQITALLPGSQQAGSAPQ